MRLAGAAQGECRCWRSQVHSDRFGNALVAGLLAAGLITGVASCAQTSPQTHPPAKTPVARGHGGAVVSDTAESTQAGLEMLGGLVTKFATRTLCHAVDYETADTVASPVGWPDGI
jgi:hypothetical protein